MTDESNGSVRITVAHVYNAVLALKDDVAHVGAQLQLHQQLPIHPGSAERIADHEARMRILEKAVGLISEQNTLLTNLEKRVWALEVNVAPAAQVVTEKLDLLEAEHGVLKMKVDNVVKRLAYIGGFAAAAALAIDTFLRIQIGH